MGKLVNFLKNEKTKNVYGTVTTLASMVGGSVIVDQLIKSKIDMTNMKSLKKMAIGASIFAISCIVEDLVKQEFDDLYSTAVGFVDGVAKLPSAETPKEPGDGGEDKNE